MVLPPTTCRPPSRPPRRPAVAVAVPELTVGVGFFTRCRALERSCYVDDPVLHNPRLLRRDLLLGVGGFDAAMSGPEDADLRQRLR